MWEMSPLYPYSGLERSKSSVLCDSRDEGTGTDDVSGSARLEAHPVSKRALLSQSPLWGWGGGPKEFLGVWGRASCRVSVFHCIMGREQEPSVRKVTRVQMTLSSCTGSDILPAKQAKGLNPKQSLTLSLGLEKCYFYYHLTNSSLIVENWPILFKVTCLHRVAGGDCILGYHRVKKICCYAANLFLCFPCGTQLGATEKTCKYPRALENLWKYPRMPESLQRGKPRESWDESRLAESPRFPKILPESAGEHPEEPKIWEPRECWRVLQSLESSWEPLKTPERELLQEAGGASRPPDRTLEHLSAWELLRAPGPLLSSAVA